MRIFQATDCYPPPLVGGRDLHVRLLAHELARRGHEVEVVTLGGRGGTRTEFDGGIPVHRIAGWSRVLNPFYADPEHPYHPTVPDPGMVRSLAALVRERRPQVVHSHSWILHSLLAFLPSHQTRLVVTMHEYGLVCPKNTFVYKSGVCTGPKFAKCIACASGQYGPLRSVALTTGLNLMRLWHHRVDRCMAVCTVAVVPSRWPEPFGRVALEAMGAGCPVVASAVGGLADLVVDGTTGILVPPGDVAALGAAIQQLLADPGRRKGMGNAGRRRAAEFTASVVIPQVEQVYDEVVGAFSSAPSP